MKKFEGCMFTTMASCDPDAGVWMIAEMSAGGSSAGIDSESDGSGLHLSSPNAKITFGGSTDGSGTCELRLKQHPGQTGPGSRYIQSTCDIENLLESSSTN